MAPRLKPIADEKELAAVPLDEPVLVELEPAVAGADNDDDGEPEKPALKVVEKDEPDDGAAKLEKALLASKEAERLSNERAAAAERERDEARQEAVRLKATNVDTEKELLNNSLATAQAEQTAAKAAFKTAFDAGDADAMADANARIARAATDIRNFEGSIAAASQEPEPEIVQQRQETPVDVMTLIDRMPNIVPKERDWLKAHPEVLVDANIGKELDVGYHRAIKAGHKRGTESYFQFLDEFMGYAEADNTPNDRTEERASIVAAPVSRDNRSSTTGQRLSSSQVKLTPEQREMAALSGVTDIEYARGLVQMEADKRANPERYATR